MFERMAISIFSSKIKPRVRKIAKYIYPKNFDPFSFIGSNIAKS